MVTKVTAKVMSGVLLACLVPCLALGAGCRGPLSGPYLDQKPPGSTPVLFAPDVLTEEMHSVTVFSPDGTEVFWGPLAWNASDTAPQLMTMRLVDGIWTAPARVSFSQSCYPWPRTATSTSAGEMTLTPTPTSAETSIEPSWSRGSTTRSRDWARR